MKKVYVASPVRPVIEDYGNRPFAAESRIRRFATDGCEIVKAEGYLPISPILAFDGVYNELTEREQIDKACETLLLACDAIYVIDTPYNKASKGIKRELEIAKANSIEILRGIKS